MESFERLADHKVASEELLQSSDTVRGAFTVFTVVIENLDNFSGEFIVELRLYDSKGLYSVENLSVVIPAGASHALAAEFDTHYGQEVGGEVSVVPPTVIEQRHVMKQRRVHRSILEILFFRLV
jgi:hypothetical protein